MDLTNSLAQTSASAPNTWVLWSILVLLAAALAASAGYLIFWLNRRLSAANAALRERERAGPADALAGPGDDGHLAREREQVGNVAHVRLLGAVDRVTRIVQRDRA